jgi:Virulence factor BrkB
VTRQVRRHDLPFYAAGLTFYAAIAVVPLLLVAWFVTSLVLGDEVVRTLTLALAEYAPTSLGLREGVRSLGEVGPRLGIASLAAALIAATSYGDGLVRALDRIAERDRRAKGLRGRGLALVFVAAVYLYLVQVVLLGGYILSLILGGLAGASSGQKISPLPWGSWPSAWAQRRNSSRPSPMSRAMNSEASSSIRWSEKPAAPSSGRAWLASSRALSTSEASGSGISSGVAGSCLSISVARSGGSGSRGRSSSGSWVAKVSSPPG